MARGAWTRCVAGGAAVWLVLLAVAVAEPPPDFFQRSNPARSSPPPPLRGKHVASYGKAYDRAYAKRHADEVVGERRKQIAACQAIEDGRALDEGRRPRDIEKEIRGGLFALAPPWESLLEDDDPILPPIRFCVRSRFWSGFGWRDIRPALDEWRDGGCPGGEIALRLDRRVRACLDGFSGEPIEERVEEGERRLSPVEAEASIRAYAALARTTGEPPFPFLRPDRFAAAFAARNDWFSPVLYRLDGLSHRRARHTLLAQLDVAGVGGEARAFALRRFEDFYAVLPDRPPVESLAVRSTRDRLVERAQRLENEAAVCEGRPEVDLVWAMERGHLFRPDLLHGAVVDVHLPLDGVVADGDCWAIRPTADEAEAECGALRALCREWDLLYAEEERIVAVRRSAWAAMPQRLPEIAEALLERQPTAAEVEIIAARFRRSVKARPVGRHEPPDQSAPDPLHVARRLTDACRAYYAGRSVDPRQSRPDVRAAARANYRALLAAERIDADEIERRLAAWDAASP